MSVEPQALERSVLERKERDELAAIAEAMGVKAGSRASKATLIDHILREAGIESGDDKPKRGRATKTDAPDDEKAEAKAEATAEGAEKAEKTDSSEQAANGKQSPDPTGSNLQQIGAPRTDERPPRDRGQQQFGGGGGGGVAEPGNRRSRRRRGRDRERGDRDLQERGGQEAQFQGEPVPVEGLLDLRDEGYGFLRTQGYLAGPKDVYVSLSQVRRFALRKGDYLQGASRPASSSEKYPALLRIDTVNGLTPDEARQRPKFEDLTPLFPDEKLPLEVPGDTNNMVARIVDLLSPIGKGQRGLIVSPPKAGKTTVLKQIAHSIEANNPEVHLMVLLVDERPEEVTDMRRSVQGEVVSSTFDRPSEEHTKLAERRIYPAIDVDASSTRHEELLFDRSQLQQVWKLRRVLNALEGGAGLELLMDKIKTTKSNDEFLAEIAKAPTPVA